MKKAQLIYEVCKLCEAIKVRSEWSKPDDVIMGNLGSLKDLASKLVKKIEMFEALEPVEGDYPPDFAYPE